MTSVPTLRSPGRPGTPFTPTGVHPAQQETPVGPQLSTLQEETSRDLHDDDSDNDSELHLITGPIPMTSQDVALGRLVIDNRPSFVLYHEHVKMRDEVAQRRRIKVLAFGQNYVSDWNTANPLFPRSHRGFFKSEISQLLELVTWHFQVMLPNGVRGNFLEPSSLQRFARILRSRLDAATQMFLDNGEPIP